MISIRNSFRGRRLRRVKAAARKRLALAAAARFAIDALEDRLFLSAWYVATNGSNNNPGTLSQPFATIQQAANVAQAGDTVFIRAGTYHETVNPANSGSAGAPITFEPYNHESVTIDGADAVKGWSSYQGKIYDAPQSWDLGEGNNQVFVDGKMIDEARYPNIGTNISAPVWTTASKVSVSLSTTGLSTVTLYNSALTQPAGAWVGAIAHIATGAEWVAQTGTVIASAPGSVTVTYFQETSSQVPKAGNRFYIVGASVALNAASEWFRNPNTGLLYVWTPASDSPANHTVEAKARSYGFDLSGDSYITIQGINLFACTINTSSSSTNNVINQITANYVSHSTGITADTQDPWGAQFHAHKTGIILNGTHNIIENSTIAYSSGDGVFLGGSFNTVQNCTIHDVAYDGGDEAGVTTLGDSEDVLYNTIYNTGRSGIVARFTTRSLISHNIVHNVGLQMTDLGAIYTWGTDGEETVISYNICYNAHTGGFGAAGIYLDNLSQGYIVDHNLVYNADFALKMNDPCRNDLIINNTFSAYTYGLESNGNQDMTGSEFLNNIFTKHCMIGSTAIIANDIFYQTNPQFVNATAYNFQLKSNSPAINSGVRVPPYTNAFTGSLPDIGAFEYGQTAWVAGASAVATPSTVDPSTPAPTTTSAKSSISAKALADQWAVVSSGNGIKFTKQWAWVEYKSVDFGAGVSKLIAQVSHLPAAEQDIRIRIDSATAANVGTLVLPASKTSTATVQTLTAALSKITGVHNVYLVLASVPDGGEFDGMTFT